MFWFIVVLLVAGAGFYFYQKLIGIEREIRAEQAMVSNRATAEKSGVVASRPAAPVSELVASERAPTVAETPVPAECSSFAEEILAAVHNLPGIMQTELAAGFPDVEKKKFQQTLKKLADDGSVRREKQGSSYLVFPV